MFSFRPFLSFVKSAKREKVQEPTPQLHPVFSFVGGILVHKFSPDFTFLSLLVRLYDQNTMFQSYFAAGGYGTLMIESIQLTHITPPKNWNQRISHLSSS